MNVSVQPRAHPGQATGVEGTGHDQCSRCGRKQEGGESASVHRVQTQFYTLRWGRGPGAGQAMMAFPYDWLRESQGLIPLSIVSRPSDTGKMIGSRTHGGVDQTLGLIGSDD